MVRKILVAYDSSDLSKKAVQEAKNQGTQAPGTEVCVIAVVNPNGPYTNVIMQQEIGDELAKDFRPEVLKLKEQFEAEGIPVHAEVLVGEVNGNPGKRICEYAEEKDIDLIIVGSRGLGNVKKLFLGSVSNNVVQNAKCPILVMK
ncbi:universal stress protein UspA [Virgibacillus indicus]|uniref:Universal stress protein UspA n=1 Tax=Virgibacillus indicus TaxID=2024554 RepID=A0A265N6S7_9BACI|nr:universal stress protein [Virgibacillus indicus]OZU87149.1 universal stress protein UspA [Virgibacillus indicus]